ncbi:MAG TPA: lysozyme inhibitor LprI family protein, partial [Longimicrobiaceae bacterium]|nr:lysozyme inhibitor LprI family protein [Longimicrobiaceae bacterium]
GLRQRRRPGAVQLSPSEERIREPPPPFPGSRTRMRTPAGGRPGNRRGAVHLFLTVLALACGVPASPGTLRAQEFHENVRHWCQDFWMLTRTEILECLMRDYAEADAELNRVYRAKMATLNPAQRRVLLADQRAWLRRYDATLTAYYSRPWANHSRVKVLPSQIRAVRDRTAYLRAVRVRA